MEDRMKRILLTGLFLLTLTIYSYAQEWMTVNQATIAWDAVTKLSDNSSVPSDNIIEYTVYLANALTDPNKEHPITVETVNGTECTVTLTEEGRYFVGVKAIRRLADGTLVSESTIGWSDDPAIAYEGNTFGLQYFLPPKVSTGLRIF